MSVENWLNNIIEEMRKSVRFQIKRAVYEYGRNRERSRTDSILDNVGMVSLAANEIWWTVELEEVFLRIKNGESNAMKKYLCQLNDQIDDLIEQGKSVEIVWHISAYIFDPVFPYTAISTNQYMQHQSSEVQNSHYR